MNRHGPRTPLDRQIADYLVGNGRPPSRTGRSGWNDLYVRRTVLVFLAAVSLVTGCHGASSALSSPVAAGPFAGTWHVHYYYLLVSPGGRGEFYWQPAAMPVGHADMVITSRSGNAADAVITSTTDRTAFHHGQTLTLRLAANDVVYTSARWVSYSYVCGPRAESYGVNCGA